MAQQIINVGSAPNDGTGDLLRDSQIKVNANFTELYNTKIESIVAGTNVTVDNTDPLNPIVSSTGGSGSTPLATTSISGTVKTDITEADPVVYTKTTVDALVQQAIGGQLSYFFFKTISDVAGYYKMLLNPSTGIAQDITIPNCSGTTTIANFITEPSAPNKTYIPKGYFRSVFHAKKTGAGNATVFYEVYKRDLAGTETLIGTSPVSDTNLTTSILEYQLEIYVPTQIALLTTDRLVYRFKTVVASGTPDVGIYFEDNYLTGLDVPSYIVSVASASKKIVFAGNSATLTGTTSVTKMVENILIPAGTVSVGNILKIGCRPERTVVTSGSSAIVMAISPVLNDTAASLIGANKKVTGDVIETTNRYVECTHSVYVKSATISETINQTVFFDNIQSANKLACNIDWTIDQYFYILMNNAQTNCTSWIGGYYIELIKST